MSLKSSHLLRSNEQRHFALKLSVCSVATALLFVGCVVGPDYKKPAAVNKMPESYVGAGQGWKIAEPQSDRPKGNWWEMFGDAELNHLEAEGAAANQELKASLARFAQARELANIAKSDLYPNIDVAPSITRERDSANRAENGHAAGHSDSFHTFSIPFDLGYELDLWGRVRRSVEAAKADVQSSADDLETLRLSIQADIAADYFTLRALDAETMLLKTNIEVYRKSLELTHNRRTGGVATDLDVSEAETVLRSAEAQLPATALERVKVQHAIALLTGQPASSFSLPERPLTLEAPEIPPGLPSELLERRPDIASAERHMAAANARIGVAQAAFYPTVRLAGTAGLESVDAGTLFSWPSRFWSVGPSLTIPIFEGGRLNANLRQTKAVYDETTANYRQQVLSAFSEVEDNLAGQQLLATEYKAQAAALASARKTLQIANNRYSAGLVTYLQVATAQNDELARERDTVRLQGQRLVTTVALIKSLGGGWKPSQLSASK